MIYIVLIASIIPISIILAIYFIGWGVKFHKLFTEFYGVDKRYPESIIGSIIMIVYAVKNVVKFWEFDDLKGFILSYLTGILFGLTVSVLLSCFKLVVIYRIKEIKAYVIAITIQFIIALIVTFIWFGFVVLIFCLAGILNEEGRFKC